MAASFAVAVEVDGCEGQGYYEEKEFQSTKSTSGSHAISICIDIRRRSLRQVHIPLLETVSIVGIRASIGISNDLIRCDLACQVREGDNPKDDGEDIESKDGPVIVDDWRTGLGNDDIDCDDDCCDGSEHSKIDAIERKERDAIGSKTHYRNSSSKLYDPQRKHCLWQNQHMLLRFSHDVNNAR